MFRKICTRCGKDSYSAASGNNEWKCPYCGKDLANEPAKPASGNQENITTGEPHPEKGGGAIR